jgi:hypothetical protein
LEKNNNPENQSITITVLKVSEKPVIHTLLAALSLLMLEHL